MVLNKRGQSVSEYAIILGLVIAVAAGVAQVLLKNALSDKQHKAVGYLMDAGSAQTEFNDATMTAAKAKIYNEDLRQTKVTAGTFKDTSVMQKGGKEFKVSKQDQVSPSSAIETIEAKTE